jgi:L-alanine-DL-glutamate epimerase-like enolase superfamily enzyme
MMKITGLRTQLVEFPYPRSMWLGHGFELRTGGCVLAFLESDQGEVGEGLAYTFNARRLKIIDEMVQSLTPLVVGLDPRQSGSFLTRATADVRTIGVSGLATTAIGAIDQALLDLRAKLAQTSVAGLLGSYRTTMPVYNSTDYWITRSLDDIQLAAADHKQRGFRGIKLRLTGKVAEDVARVKAVREVLGPDFSVLGDLNQRSTVSDAIRLGRVLEEFNLTWLEEPVPCHDHAGEAAVAAALVTPLASGESIYGSRGIREMLKVHACDIVMPDLQHMGGPTEFMRAAAFADAYDTPASNHCYTEMSLQLLAAIPNFIVLEYMPWLEPIYAERIQLDAHGHAIVPDRPGWGFAFDQGVLKKYNVAR